MRTILSQVDPLCLRLVLSRRRPETCGTREQVHLTLKSWGMSAPRKVEEVKSALAQVTSTFSLEIKGAGAFPKLEEDKCHLGRGWRGLGVRLNSSFGRLRSFFTGSGFK